MGLREMITTMNRFLSKLTRKMDKKIMKNIFHKCGFCVNPKRTNSVTLLGDVGTSIHQRNTFLRPELSTKE